LKQNLRWTSFEVLSSIRDNIYGKYWCQLDSDDYLDSDFLDSNIKLADENNADIVQSKFLYFAEDKDFISFDKSNDFDFRQKFSVNMNHSPICIIGNDNIIEGYAKDIIYALFWAKLYKASVMSRFLSKILDLPCETREVYFQLDIAWTYQISSIANRVFFNDKVLYYASFRTSNSTFSLSPIEWLMSLIYAYRNIKSNLSIYRKKNIAYKCSKKFLNLHLWWQVNRKTDILEIVNHKYRNEIRDSLKFLYNDEIFNSIMLNPQGLRKNNYLTFYTNIQTVIKEEMKF
jgi:hypothetical protein